MIEQLLPFVNSPDRALFFGRGAADDPRLGEQVRSDPADLADAAVVLLGCPQDEGVRRNGGRVGAALAPTAIRERLYRLVAIDGLRLFDLGDLRIAPTLEQTHAAQRAVVTELLTAGKRVIVLGGGNDLAYPDCAALADASGGPVLAFNVDAHFDVRPDTPRNSGTPYRMLLDEGVLAGEHFWELGHLPFAVAAAHQRYLDAQGAQVRSLMEWRAAGISATLAGALAASACPAVFWGLDVDAVTAADAPGVSAPNPAGLSASEFLEVAALAGREPRSRVLELTELNPTYDIDGRTARLAAAAVWCFLAGQL